MTSLSTQLSSDFIGPISKATFLFTQQRWRHSFFSLGCVTDVTHPIVGNFCQTFLQLNTSEKISPRRDSNGGPLGKKILRSEQSSTELAGPGSAHSYGRLKLLPLGIGVEGYDMIPNRPISTVSGSSKTGLVLER